MGWRTKRKTIAILFNCNQLSIVKKYSNDRKKVILCVCVCLYLWKWIHSFFGIRFISENLVRFLQFKYRKSCYIKTTLPRLKNMKRIKWIFYNSCPHFDTFKHSRCLSRINMHSMNYCMYICEQRCSTHWFRFTTRKLIERFIEIFHLGTFLIFIKMRKICSRLIWFLLIFLCHLLCI